MSHDPKKTNSEGSKDDKSPDDFDPSKIIESNPHEIKENSRDRDWNWDSGSADFIRGYEEGRKDSEESNSNSYERGYEDGKQDGSSECE